VYLCQFLVSMHSFECYVSSLFAF